VREQIDKALFSRLLGPRHPTRKRSGSIFTKLEPTRCCRRDSTDCHSLNNRRPQTFAKTADPAKLLPFAWNADHLTDV